MCKEVIVFEKEKWDRIKSSFEKLSAQAEKIWIGVWGTEKELTERDRRQKVKWRKSHIGHWNSIVDGGRKGQNERKKHIREMYAFIYVHIFLHIYLPTLVLFSYAHLSLWPNCFPILSFLASCFFLSLHIPLFLNLLFQCISASTKKCFSFLSFIQSITSHIYSSLDTMKFQFPGT